MCQRTEMPGCGGLIMPKPELGSSATEKEEEEMEEGDMH
jgi:hypothetical protein